MDLLSARLIWLAVAAVGVMLLIPPGGGNADVQHRLAAVARRMLRWGPCGSSRWNCAIRCSSHARRPRAGMPTRITSKAIAI